MEYITNIKPGEPVKAVLFDFDGTISTLRCGWESVMQPLMLEMISGGHPYGDALVHEIDAYIDTSTGIQTIFQMKWLAEQVASRGMNPGAPSDPWWYKAEYSRRLALYIADRKLGLSEGRYPPSDFIIGGSVEFLSKLKEKSIKMYVASGTDHPDVVEEAGALGVADFFDEIAGAPPHEENCSKESVLNRLVTQYGLRGNQVAVIGDGKVEIALGRAIGARTLGLATDEINRFGISQIKRGRLLSAGADVIDGDFCDMSGILSWLGLSE